MSKLNLKDLTFVTSNKNKVREIKEILGPNIKIREINLPEIQSLNLDEVITEKAKEAFKIVKKPIVVEDVSLEVEALKGLPGTFVKFFLQTIGTEGTAKLVGKNSTFTTVTAAFALYDGKKIKIFKGSIRGKLIKKNKGENGFGFDKIFVPTGFKETYAQLSSELKNKISHRAKALKKLKDYLSK